MIAAHQTMLAPQGAPLPYDAEVEYVGSTGAQYVDTGVYLDNSLAYEITFAGTHNSVGIATIVLFGGRGSTNDTNQRIIFYDNEIRVQRNAFTARVSVPYDKNWHTAYSSASEVRIDSTSGTSSSAGDTTVNAYVFRQNNNNGSSAAGYCNAKVSSCKIWSSGVLVRDFIPVRVGQVGYLYDRASGTLFGNAGTGAFVVGSDK